MDDITTLTPEQRGVLEFENRGRWKFGGAKETRVREELGMSMTRYHQVLNAAIDKHEAPAAFPHLVRRLKSVREADKRQRHRATQRAS